MFKSITLVVAVIGLGGCAVTPGYGYPQYYDPGYVSAYPYDYGPGYGGVFIGGRGRFNHGGYHGYGGYRYGGDHGGGGRWSGGGGPVAEASMAAVIMEAVLMEAAGTVELRAPFAFGAVGQTTASEYLSNFRPLPVAIVTRKHDA
jgi:hypothetical protein